jgi:hypothetical protein
MFASFFPVVIVITLTTAVIVALVLFGLLTSRNMVKISQDLRNNERPACWKRYAYSNGIILLGLLLTIAVGLILTM